MTVQSFWDHTRIFIWDWKCLSFCQEFYSIPFVQTIFILVFFIFTLKVNVLPSFQIPDVEHLLTLRKCPDDTEYLHNLVQFTFSVTTSVVMNTTRGVDDVGDLKVLYLDYDNFA